MAINNNKNGVLSKSEVDYINKILNSIELTSESKYYFAGSDKYVKTKAEHLNDDDD